MQLPIPMPTPLQCSLNWGSEHVEEEHEWWHRYGLGRGKILHLRVPACRAWITMSHQMEYQPLDLTQQVALRIRLW